MLVQDDEFDILVVKQELSNFGDGGRPDFGCVLNRVESNPTIACLTVSRSVSTPLGLFLYRRSLRWSLCCSDPVLDIVQYGTFVTRTKEKG